MRRILGESDISISLDLSGVNPQASQFLFKHINSSPWAAWVTTSLIRVAIMLEQKMETQPMHLLKNLIIIFAHFDWFPACHAQKLFIRLNQFFPTPMHGTFKLEIIGLAQ